MQQHNQLPTKVMMGLNAAMGMGNMGNNMVGIAGLGNVMGMGSQSQVTSPSMAGSPTLVQQQMNQMSPQQFNGSISSALPASPQLGSQTHGSIGSIAGSPMEQLQGANKGGNSNI
ncbi:hypothetical protein KSP40_PGU008969 [Platanthera guangdongensis]|uniref:Uncharacterized protein n=1 Tax=Platanthera guangdongensis TaxID=2320717 RepID=A0ABR2MTQ7_9ASPA